MARILYRCKSLIIKDLGGDRPQVVENQVLTHSRERRGAERHCLRTPLGALRQGNDVLGVERKAERPVFVVLALFRS
jgi:hypothetical protein